MLHNLVVIFVDRECYRCCGKEADHRGNEYICGAIGDSSPKWLVIDHHEGNTTTTK
jgi:hypothetical protein